MVIQTLFVPARSEDAITAEEVEQAIHGHLKVIRVAGEYGFSRTELLPLRLNPKEQNGFREGKERGYLFLRGGERRLFDVWRRYCQAGRQPMIYVLIEEGGPLATVGVDMTTTRGKRLTDKGLRIIGLLFRTCRHAKERYSRTLLPDIGPLACEDRCISCEQAEELAQSLRGIAAAETTRFRMLE